MNKIESAESLLADAVTLPEKIDALNALAWELRFDDVLRAKRVSQAAHNLAASAENDVSPYLKGLAESLCTLGHCQIRLADYEAALPLLQQSLTLFETLADPLSQGTVLYLLGSAYWSLGDYYHALECTLQAIEFCRAGNDRFGLAKAWNIVGLIYQAIGNLPEALEHYQKSWQIYEEIGNKRGQGDTLNNSSEAAFELGDYENALTFGLRSLALHEEINYQDDLGIVLTAVGRAYAALQQPRQALDCLHRGLNISRAGANRYSELRCLLYLGEVYNQQGDRNLALSLLQQALPLAHEIESRQELYECYRILADIYKQEADFERALAAYEQFHALKEGVLSEIAKQKLDILALVQRIEVTRREAEIQRLKNAELEQEIAERRRVEAQLREREQFIENVVVTSPDILYVYHIQDQRASYINQTLSETLGYSQTEVETLDLEPIHKLMHPQDLARFPEQIARLAASQPREVFEFEYRMRHKNGEWRWFLSRDVVFKRGPDGSLSQILGLAQDITERKQAEEALRTSEERLRQVFASISDHIYVTEYTPTGQHFNRYLSPIDTLTGYPLEKLMADWSFWPSTLIHPDDRAKAADQVERFAQGQNSELEYRMIRADGRIVWVRDSGRVVQDPRSQSLFVYGVVSDITARKQAEDALRQSEARQRALLEAIPDLILRISRDGTYLDCKPARDLDTILPTSDLIGKKIFEVLPFEVAQQRLQYIEQTLQTGTVQTVEYQLQWDGDQIRHQEARFVTSGEDEVLLIVRDVTERKLAEQALRQTRDELAARVEELETLNFIMRTVTTTLDLQTALGTIAKTVVQLLKARRCGVALLNVAATELKIVAEFGASESIATLIGKVISVSPEESFQVLQSTQAVVIPHAYNYPLTAQIHEMLHQVGSDSLMVIPLFIAGKVIGVIGVDRAWGEPEFTQAEIRLAETIAAQIAGAVEITRLLNEEHQLRQSAEVASEFKSQLLARVSHELRTPLGSILGYSELLQEGIFGPVTAEQKQAVAEIMESTQYLTSLVNELLDQAQYERGNIELHLTPLSLDNLISQVESRISILARRKHLALSFELDPALPATLLGDQKRLQQVLINLVNNAIKFTKTGQVKVRLFKISPTQWAMEVADTGPGISPEAQEFIFEPFRQADGSITRAHGGTGLGLAIVKQLTTLMKGQVSLTSKVGQGSTFRVTLPLELMQEQTHE